MPTHQLRADGMGINVAGWEGANDSLVVKQSQLVSITFTATTTPTGQINVPTTPIAALSRSLDYLGNLTNNYGITILDAGNGTVYYSSNVDPTAGLMSVVTAQGGSTTVNSTSVKVTYFYLAPLEGTLNADGTVTPNFYIQSNVIVPTDLQSHLQTTIQTHNAVSIAISGSSSSAWMDTDGFDKIAISARNDGATSFTAQIQWSNDNNNIHGADTVIPANTNTYGDGIIDTRARYFKLTLYNNDGAAAHTMSAWAYLKA